MLDFNTDILANLIQKDIEKNNDSALLPESDELLLKKIDGDKIVITETAEENKAKTETLLAILGTLKEQKAQEAIKESKQTEITYENLNTYYITSYKDFVSRVFDVMLEEETKDDATVQAYIESILSIVDIFSNKGILPKHILLTENSFNILKSQLKNKIEVATEALRNTKVLDMKYPELDEYFDKDIIVSLTDTIKYYTSMLDSVVVGKNIKELDKNERELLKLYIYDRDALFDYLVGKYVTKYSELKDTYSEK